jgi:hypothetical protein
MNNKKIMKNKKITKNKKMNNILSIQWINLIFKIVNN